MVENSVNINSFIRAIIRYVLGIVIGVFVLSMIVIMAGHGDKSILQLVISFNEIIYIGVILSLLIHELAHYVAMRVCGVKEIGISSSLYRFSVYTYEDVKGKKLLIIALAGVISALMCGGILSVINIFLHNDTLKVIIWIYFIHLINILPCFGDGKMILKALFTIKDA